MTEQGIQQIEMIGYKVVHQPKWNCLIGACMKEKTFDETTIVAHMLMDHGLPPEKIELDIKDGSVWIRDGLYNINEGQTIN